MIEAQSERVLSASAHDATEIAQALGALRERADRTGLDVLAYLLDLARMEATASSERREGGGRPG